MLQKQALLLKTYLFLFSYSTFILTLSLAVKRELRYNLFMAYFLKAIPALIFWGVFTLVIFTIPYPETLTSASSIQLLAFFIPLFLSLVFTFEIFIKFLPRSIALSFGLIILLILKPLGSLNLVSTSLTIVAIFLLISYFKKKRLTSRSNVPKIRNLSRRKRR